MDVFVSWSGDRSRAVAVALKRWLPQVLQSLDVYVSSEDIEKGARWSANISRRLDETSFGIICVTPENAREPWINFEAGALAKSFDTSRVTPFLTDMAPSDLIGPLAQFQATLPVLEDIRRLVHSLNVACAQPLDEPRVDEAVNLWWPRLESELQKVPAAPTSGKKKVRDETDMLAELLDVARSMQYRLARLEDQDSRRDSVIHEYGTVKGARDRDMRRAFEWLSNTPEVRESGARVFRHRDGRISVEVPAECSADTVDRILRVVSEAGMVVGNVSYYATEPAAP